MPVGFDSPACFTALLHPAALLRELAGAETEWETPEGAVRVVDLAGAVRTVGGRAQDLGLLSEEYDTVAHRQLGNTPQAFSHVGLVNTARHLGTAVSEHHPVPSRSGSQS
ncbi:MAG TPA: glycoside hydrolase family 15 protein [Pseudonocardiaceae bacterium]|nr:glycoside hydrolase family 15 protein [Pseudonocardiaceae bacterium]